MIKLSYCGVLDQQIKKKIIGLPPVCLVFVGLVVWPLIFAQAHIRRCLQEKGEEEQKVFARLSAEFGAAISDNFITLLYKELTVKNCIFLYLYICIYL